MRRIVLITILLLTGWMGLAQTTIGPVLMEALNRCTDNERIEVVVLMKAQYDRQQLCRQAEFIPTKAIQASVLSDPMCVLLG